MRDEAGKISELRPHLVAGLHPGRLNIIALPGISAIRFDACRSAAQMQLDDPAFRRLDAPGCDPVGGRVQ